MGDVVILDLENLNAFRRGRSPLKVDLCGMKKLTCEDWIAGNDSEITGDTTEEQLKITAREWEEDAGWSDVYLTDDMLETITRMRDARQSVGHLEVLWNALRAASGDQCGEVIVAMHAYLDRMTSIDLSWGALAICTKGLPTVEQIEWAGGRYSDVGGGWIQIDLDPGMAGRTRDAIARKIGRFIDTVRTVSDAEEKLGL